MKISVLTVARNSAGTIQHTLDSFFEQNHADKELVIVDGASSDETLRIVASYPQDQIRLLSEPDKGMYDALNKAMQLFTGDAVGVLNSDDAFHDASVLSRIDEALGFSKIVHGHLVFVESHESKQIVRRWRAQKQPEHGFRTGWMPAHPTFYVRREIAERVGAFDLSLPVAADYDWMLRAIEMLGQRSLLVDHVLVDMMQGGTSTVSLASHISHNLEALRARRRWLGAGLIDYALLAKPLRKIGQFSIRREVGSGTAR